MAADFPEEAIALNADELRDILATGDHPEPRGSFETDQAIVGLVRKGLVLAVRLVDGRIAFSPVDPEDGGLELTPGGEIPYLDVPDDELPGMWERADFIDDGPDLNRGPDWKRPADQDREDGGLA